MQEHERKFNKWCRRLSTDIDSYRHRGKIKITSGYLKGTENNELVRSTNLIQNQTQWNKRLVIETWELNDEKLINCDRGQLLVFIFLDWFVTEFG